MKKGGTVCRLFLSGADMRYGFIYSEIAEMATTTIVTMILHLVFMLFSVNQDAMT